MEDSSERKMRQYHPYQDLNIPINNLYNLPTSPEHLFDEERIRKHRTITENLTFYSGCSYLTGSFLGAAKGAIEGLKAAEQGDSLKIRTNRVLNAGGLNGRRFGCSLGLLGMIFSVVESGVVHARGTDDLLNTVLSGLGTGALYKAASGPRSAVIAGAIGGITAAAAVAGKHAFKRYVPI